MAEKAEEGSQQRMREARDHMKAAGTCLRKGFEGFMPKEFVEHRRAARKEMLLAMRSLLDAAIERFEQKA